MDPGAMQKLARTAVDHLGTLARQAQRPMDPLQLRLVAQWAQQAGLGGCNCCDGGRGRRGEAHATCCCRLRGVLTSPWMVMHQRHASAGQPAALPSPALPAAVVVPEEDVEEVTAVVQRLADPNWVETIR